VVSLEAVFRKKNESSLKNKCAIFRVGFEPALHKSTIELNPLPRSIKAMQTIAWQGNAHRITAF
jgi:hypothetical protein